MTNEEAASYFEEIIECADFVDASYTDCIKVEAIRTAYKALQERKTGKWVLAHPLQKNDGGAYVCSCCKSGSYEVIPKTWKACPWCTALMEVDE